MVDEPPKASGRLGTFENLKGAVAIRRRVFGGWRFVWVGVLFLIVIIVTAIAIVLGSRLPIYDGWSGILWWIGYIVALAASLYGWARLTMAWSIKRLNARGVAADINLSYVAAPEGLRFASDLGEGLAYWSSLNEVALDGKYWMLITAGMAYLVPRRFFATPAAERAFVSGVLEHLEPAARARSQSATDFLS